MEDILQSLYGFKEISIKRINGYSNANYLIKADGDNYIFKTYLYSQETWRQVEAENEILSELEKNSSSLFPKPISFADGSYIKEVIIEEESLICRMLSFIEGDFLGDVSANHALYTSIGVFLANMNLRLKGIRNAVLESRRLVWDLDQLSLNEPFIEAIDDPHNRNIVRYFFLQHKEHVRPVLHTFRKSLVHNDANEWNLLVKEDQISSIIDFGDMVYTSLINELAIAITYSCYGQEDPLKWSRPILEGYHSVIPLEKRELDALYYLVASRLCISVCQSAKARKEDPSNTYTSVSEAPAWEMLYKWLSIGPIQARHHFYESLGMPFIKKDPVEDAVKRRMQSLSPLLSISYDKPIYMEKAAFQYMYDGYGNVFLDSYNNIPHVGHCHPRVVEAGQKQMAMLNTNTRYVYEQLAEYAEKLLGHFPPELNRVFFVNSGSAASDLAVRMARSHTKKNTLMVMEHGYHGNTQTSIDISHYKFDQAKGQGQKSYILKAHIPNAYNGIYQGADSGKLYAKDAVEQIQRLRDSIGAFIAEPIVGCGGQVPLAKGYLKEVYPAIRKQGGICISDEVQTGFGRLGDYFWGYEAQDVIPDVVILGKPIANGHPMGAVVCTEEIAASFAAGVEFFSSFGGNPVSCEIAKTVLEVLEEEQLQLHAKQVGEYYMTELNALKMKFPYIGDVRGSGLFIGVEMVEPGTTHANKSIAQHIKNELRENHILVSTDGPYDNVLKMKPPLCFNMENAKEVIDQITVILSQLQE